MEDIIIEIKWHHAYFRKVNTVGVAAVKKLISTVENTDDSYGDMINAEKNTHTLNLVKTTIHTKELHARLHTIT